MTSRRFLVAFSLLALVVFARMVPHVANFSPLIAVTIFSGFIFKRPTGAFLLPLGVLFISDLSLYIFRPEHAGMVVPSVYWALGFIALTSWSAKTFYKSSLGSAGYWLSAGAGPSLFFVGTNFSTWMFTTMYPHTLDGLIQCYLMALPFYKNSLISTALYLTAFYAVTQSVTAASKKWAH